MTDTIHIVLAMKPIEGNFAQNALEHEVAGLNIDGCRIEYQGEADKASATPQGECTARSGRLAGKNQGGGERGGFDRPEQLGRFPANVIHDGSDEVAELFPSVGKSTGGGMNRSGQNNNTYGKQQGHPKVRDVGFGDSGSASRFFKECKIDD